MTSYFDFGNNLPVSAVTLNSLRDIGYRPNLCVAQPFELRYSYDDGRDNTTVIEMVEGGIDTEPIDVYTYELEHSAIDAKTLKLGKQKLWIASCVAIIAMFLALVVIMARRRGRRNVLDNLYMSNEKA